MTWNIDWFFHGNYSIISFKYNYLKIGYHIKLHHKFTEDDKVIAYSYFNFIVIDLKAACNICSGRELWHEKLHLYNMHGSIYSIVSTIFYFVGPIFCLVSIYIFIFDNYVKNSATPKTYQTINICWLLLLTFSRFKRCYQMGVPYWYI